MDNRDDYIYFYEKGKIHQHKKPKYGIMVLTVVDGKVTMIETTVKNKIDTD